MENNKMDSTSSPQAKLSEEKESRELALHYMETLIDVARESFLILNADLRVMRTNSIFYQNFHVSPKETENVLLYDLGNGQWDIPELRRLLEEILPQKKIVTDFEVTHVFETIGEKTILLNARQLETVQLIILAMEDITARKQMENQLANTAKEQVIKVAERTKELAEKINELEELNEAMVGRELKMRELKQKITELENKAKNLKS